MRILHSPSLLSLLLFFVFSNINSQDALEVSSYDWEDTVDLPTVKGKGKAMMSLKEKYIVEFAYSQDDVLEEYYLEHKVLWLNSNERIDAYNKIYLPYSETSDLLKSKARVITGEGKILELDDSKILSAEDEETGKSYKYFAFEGVEKGSVIEYFYLEKKQPSFRGSAFRFQSDYDIKNIDFDLYSPSNLIFAFKSYNGLPEISKDTLIKTKQHWSLNVNAMEGLQEEEQSPYNASRAYLIYKLDKNTAKNLSDISSYGNVSQNIYNYYYKEPSKKTASMVEEFIKQTISNGDIGLESKLRRLGNTIKTDFYLTKGGDASLSDLEEILTKKVVNTSGIMKLYISVLRHLGIQHEIVITSNREDLKFDKAFEAHNFLNDYLIYFPQWDTYVSPTETSSRYGYPPAWLTDNYGLFIKEVSVGNFKSGVGEIKYIHPLEADKTTDEMIIDVEFDSEDLTSNRIKLDRSFSGYYAMPIHPYMYLVKGDDREEILNGLAKSMNDNVSVVSSSVLNQDPDLFGIKPIHFVLDIKANSFVEKAGKKYLFKIGELIGSQIQMYQEKERKLPLENEFMRSYYRTIKVELPEGYQVSNLDELSIDNNFVENGKDLFSFKSSYELKGQTLKVKADEHYNVNIVSPTLYEEYRKVINSAADFNKITLVLEPLD